MKTLTSLSVALALTSPAAAFADTYGLVELSYGNDTYSVDQTGTADVVTLSGFVGTDLPFAGMYLEGDFRFANASPNNSSVEDGLLNGSMGLIRVGNDFGSYSVEAFLGRISVESGESSGSENIQRDIIGLAAGYDVSSALRLNTMLSYMDGAETNSSNSDAMRRYTTFAVGADYILNDHWSFQAQAALGDGVMDQDDDLVSSTEISLGATYTFDNPNMSAFVEYRTSDYFQGGENDTSITDSITVGFVYSFGDVASDRRRDRMDMPNYLEGLGTTDGILE